MAKWNTVNISYVIKKNRIDSEFYKKDDVHLENYLNNVCQGLQLKNVVFEIKDRFSKSMSTKIQYNDIGNTDITFGSISDNILDSHMAPGRATYINKVDDILISTVRPNRNANAIVNSKNLLQVGSNGFCNIRSRNLDANYIYIYSKTKYFINTLIRCTTSSMYPSVSNKNILEVPFFIPKNNDLELIVNTIKTARKQLIQSKEYFIKANKLLEKELGLDQVVFKKSKLYTTNFSELIGNNRIDADFYNPDYEMLKKYLLTINGMKLKEIANLKSGFAFASKKYKSTGKQIVRIQNISGDLLNLNRNPVFYSNSDLRNLNDFKISKGDTLMAMTGNTIGNCSLNTSDKELYLNQRVLSVTPNTEFVSAEYLNLILRNVTFKTFIERELVGGAQPNISLNFIGNQIIPLVKVEKMNTITTYLKEHYKLSFSSKELLEQAKSRVEQLIEEAAR